MVGVADVSFGGKDMIRVVFNDDADVIMGLITEYMIVQHDIPGLGFKAGRKMIADAAVLLRQFLPGRHPSQAAKGAFLRGKGNLEPGGNAGVIDERCAPEPIRFLHIPAAEMLHQGLQIAFFSIHRTVEGIQGQLLCSFCQNFSAGFGFLIQPEHPGVFVHGIGVDFRQDHAQPAGYAHGRPVIMLHVAVNGRETEGIKGQLHAETGGFRGIPSALKIPVQVIADFRQHLPVDGLQRDAAITDELSGFLQDHRP